MDMAITPQLHTYRLFYQADDSSFVAGKKGKRVVLYQRETENEVLKLLGAGINAWFEIEVLFRQTLSAQVAGLTDVSDVRARKIAETEFLDKHGRGLVWEWHRQKAKMVRVPSLDTTLLAKEANRIQRFDFKVTPEIMQKAQQLRRGAA